ncbi:MAG: prepilin-type N-terminal cleavage/methylation domain-containing protein [Deltaproteobacteria bacterium]|nr:prepilin-type N-terminal cleavage/methylation domain-containing protein [Deltaproteobacteria bacterium]
MDRKTKGSSLTATGVEHGFTLIEVLVTVLILTIGLLGTAGLTMGIIRGNFFSKNITSATAIAQTQLDAVQREGYANTTTTTFPSSAQPVTMGGMSFSRTTTITPNSPAANMKTVAVTVNWNEANNAARSVILQTIVAQ